MRIIKVYSYNSNSFGNIGNSEDVNDKLFRGNSNQLKIGMSANTFKSKSFNILSPKNNHSKLSKFAKHPRGKSLI